MKINDEKVMAVCPETGMASVSTGFGSRWIKVSAADIAQAVAEGTPSYTADQAHWSPEEQA